MTDTQDIVYRLQKRAEIRRQIPGRKSTTTGEPDRIADLLDEAAREIDGLRALTEQMKENIDLYEERSQRYGIELADLKIKHRTHNE